MSRYGPCYGQSGRKLRCKFAVSVNSVRLMNSRRQLEDGQDQRADDGGDEAAHEQQHHRLDDLGEGREALLELALVR